jgi:receptor protein-tyrosine kinase
LKAIHNDGYPETSTMVADKDARREQFDDSLAAKDLSRLGRELVACHTPSVPQAAAFRSLAMQLMLGTFSATGNALAIVSPSSGDGRSFVAANLAVIFSQLGQRTLLIDAHLQEPRLHEIFDIGNAAGLSSILGGQASGTLKPVHVPQLRNLWLVPGGPQLPNADELLARDGFADVCNALKHQNDVVLFDTSPGETSTGADWVANRCGKALIVVRRNRTEFADTKAFLGRVKSRAEIVGCVLNRY